MNAAVASVNAEPAPEVIYAAGTSKSSANLFPAAFCNSIRGT